MQSFDVLKKVGDVVRFPPPQITKRSHVPSPFRIGDEAYCIAVIEEKGFRAEELLLQLPKLNDPQVTVTLLHMCGAYILSLVHPFRSCNHNYLAWCTPSYLVTWLSLIKIPIVALEECGALQLTDQARSQASLSISWWGGAGIVILGAASTAEYLTSPKFAGGGGGGGG